MLLRDMLPVENNTKEIKLKKISQNPNELEYLSTKLNKITKDLSDNQVIFFNQKQFIYPMTISGIVIIAIIIIITYIIVVKIKRRNKIAAEFSTIKKISELECNNVGRNCTIINE